MSADELKGYMAAQRDMIAEAHDANAPHMDLDLYAILWIEANSATFRTAWEG